MKVIRYSNIQKLLSKNSMYSFDYFIRGQTCGMDKDGEYLIYYDDFMRWFHSNLRTKELDHGN